MRVTKVLVIKGLLLATATVTLFTSPANTFVGKVALAFIATTIGSEIGKSRK